MRRVLMIAQAPSRTASGPPCSGPSFQRMARVCGAKTDEEVVDFLGWFERTNLLPEYPGPASGKGDAFPAAAAELAAEAMGARVIDRIVLLVGRSVQRAFGVAREAEFLTWYGRCRNVHKVSPFEWRAVAIVPHPSGVSTWWNDPANRRRARKFFDRLRRTEDVWAR